MNRKLDAGMNSMRSVPKSSSMKSDESAIAGLRLMRCFFRLKSRARREELITLAERLLEEELTQSKNISSENLSPESLPPENTRD